MHIIYMLPLKRINTGTRHRTYDSKSTAFFEINLIGNITLPFNTAFYITDITDAVEAGNCDVIYFRINGTGYAIAQCTIPVGDYTTITFGAALCKATNDNYTFTGPTGGTKPTNFVSTANLANNIIIISNPTDTFEIFIDEQVVAFMFEVTYTPKVPTCSVNDVLRNTVENIIPAEEARQVGIIVVLDKVWTSGC